MDLEKILVSLFPKDIASVVKEYCAHTLVTFIQTMDQKDLNAESLKRRTLINVFIFHARIWENQELCKTNLIGQAREYVEFVLSECFGVSRDVMPLISQLLRSLSFLSISQFISDCNIAVFNAPHLNPFDKREELAFKIYLRTFWLRPSSIILVNPRLMDPFKLSTSEHPTAMRVWNTACRTFGYHRVFAKFNDAVENMRLVAEVREFWRQRPEELINASRPCDHNGHF